MCKASYIVLHETYLWVNHCAINKCTLLLGRSVSAGILPGVKDHSFSAWGKLCTCFYKRGINSLHLYIITWCLKAYLCREWCKESLFQNIHMNGLMIHETLLAKCRNSGSAIIAECNMFHTKCMLQCFGSLHMMIFFLCWTDQCIQRYSRAPIAWASVKGSRTKKKNKNDHNKSHAHTKSTTQCNTLT